MKKESIGIVLAVLKGTQAPMSIDMGTCRNTTSKPLATDLGHMRAV